MYRDISEDFQEMPTSISIVETNTIDIVKEVKSLSPLEPDTIPTSHQRESTTNAPQFDHNSSFTPSKTIDPKVWVMAAEFIPRKYQTNIVNDDDKVKEITNNPSIKSQAQLDCTNLGLIKTFDSNAASSSMLSPLCPYLNSSEKKCRYGDRCGYEHGELCDLCGYYCLNPSDKQQRKQHQTECIQQHENNMKLAFAMARSRHKTCGICFEVIMEKVREQRFGILPSCNHIFCLECIRKWRQEKQFKRKVIRACPECRTTSDFVCPSSYWVDTKDDKDKLLSDYKKAMEATQCKYFKQGDGTCPFGNKCFYKHALPNGTRVDVGVSHLRRDD